MTADVLPRRNYIGGGTIAAVLGLSPWHSPLDAYLDLVEGELEISAEKRQFFDDRRDLEPWACAKFQRYAGLVISRTNKRYDDVEFPWAKAEIDAEVYESAYAENLEIKTVNPSSAWLWPEEDSGEEPPAYVTAQAMWGLGITGRDRCHVFALIGFDEARVYTIERDEALILDIRERARAFWDNHVAKRRPPAPTTLDDLKRLYPRDTGSSIEATPAVIAALESRAQHQQVEKRAINAKLLDEFAIKAHMGAATTLTVRGKPVASWKQRSDGTRVFRTL